MFLRAQTVSSSAQREGDDNTHALNHGSRHGQLERALGWANVVWLLVVGLQTRTVLHHVFHALPLALLSVLPRTPWYRHVAAMAGLVWIVMLSLLSPMISGVMREGIRIGERGLAYTWLAPVMLLLAAAWGAVNLAWLGGRPSRWPVWMLAIVVSGVVLGWVQPSSQGLFEAPVARALDRAAPAYAPLVVLALALALGVSDDRASAERAGAADFDPALRGVSRSTSRGRSDAPTQRVEKTTEMPLSSR